MAKESILQIRIDSDLKEAAEALYRGMGTSLPEAVRIFARQSIIAEGMPFALRSPARRKPSLFGVLGKYSNPALRKQEKGAFAKAMEEKHARFT